MSKESKSNAQSQEAKPPIPPPPLMPSGPINAPAAAPPPPRQDETKRRNPLLNNWSVILSEAGPLEDSGRIRVKLQGEIQGHPNPRFTDGEVIQSSELLGLDVGAKMAKTKHTTYELGEPDPTFLEYVENLGKQLSDYNFSYEENLRKKPRSL